VISRGEKVRRRIEYGESCRRASVRGDAWTEGRAGGWSGGWGGGWNEGWNEGWDEGGGEGCPGLRSVSVCPEPSGAERSRAERIGAERSGIAVRE
jgi:hypothetical protein